MPVIEVALAQGPRDRPKGRRDGDLLGRAALGDSLEYVRPEGNPSCRVVLPKRLTRCDPAYTSQTTVRRLTRHVFPKKYSVSRPPFCIIVGCNYSLRLLD